MENVVTNDLMQTGITVADLSFLKELIEVSAKAGIIHPRSFIGVGTIYQKLEDVVNLAAQQQKPA